MFEHYLLYCSNHVYVLKIKIDFNALLCMNIVLYLCFDYFVYKIKLCIIIMIDYAIFVYL